MALEFDSCDVVFADNEREYAQTSTYTNNEFKFEKASTLARVINERALRRRIITAQTITPRKQGFEFTLPHLMEPPCRYRTGGSLVPSDNPVFFSGCWFRSPEAVLRTRTCLKSRVLFRKNIL